MSHEVCVVWKIKVKDASKEIVVGMNPDRVEKIFTDLEKKYLK